MLPVASDECVLDTDVPFPALNITFRDVGPSITAVSGGFTVTAARDTSQPPDIFYDGFQAGAYTTGSYAITAGADSLRSITIPGPVEWTNSGVTIVPGEPLELTFTPNSGSSYVEIWLENALGDVVYNCYVEADGSFTVPGDITNEIGADGFVDVESGGWHAIGTIDGKKLLLSGYNY